MTNSGLGDIQKGGNWREVTTSGFESNKGKNELRCSKIFDPLF